MVRSHLADTLNFGSKPEGDWLPPEIDSLPNIDQPIRFLALDVETNDPLLKSHGPSWKFPDQGFICGIALATADWELYLPIRHDSGNLPVSSVKKYVQRAIDNTENLICHNANYDLGWLKREGFKVDGPRIICTMVTAGLLEDRYSLSLNSVAFDYLGKIKSEQELKDAAASFGYSNHKANMYKLHSSFVGAYAEWDARLCFDLFIQKQQSMLVEQDLNEVWELESNLLPLLVEMTFRGIRLDIDQAEKTREIIKKREKQTLSKIKKLTNTNVEIWAARSIGKAFDELGLEYPRTAKSKEPSFTKNFLSEHEHPLAALILEARELNKVSGTFLDGLLEKACVNGRIHPDIHQIKSEAGGAITGRLSMSNPNGQNFPARNKEVAGLIRALFLAEEGEKFCSIDYSQQEPLILLHYAKILGDLRNDPIPGVQQFVDSFHKDNSVDFHTLVSQVASIPRPVAKVVNLSLMYGMGISKLGQALDLTFEDAKELIKKYHTEIPFVKEVSTSIQNRLKSPASNGSIRSLKGRKSRFDKWEPAGWSKQIQKSFNLKEAIDFYGPNTQLQRSGLYRCTNRLIQSSAADMTKQAMVNIYKNHGKIPLLSIHDELAFSVEGKAEAEMLSKEMVEAIPLEVPISTSIKIGENWGNIKEINGV